MDSCGLDILKNNPTRLMKPFVVFASIIGCILLLFPYDVCISITNTSSQYVPVHVEPVEILLKNSADIVLLSFRCDGGSSLIIYLQSVQSICRNSLMTDYYKLLTL